MTFQSIGCARCGDCCEPVVVDVKHAAVLATWQEHANDPNPHTATGWAAWQADGWKESRTKAQKAYDSSGTNRWNGAFTAEHWHRRDDSDDQVTRFDCDQFNSDTRLCMAGDTRPPICQGFPWYGQAPSPEQARGIQYPHCSYLHDVPSDQRPPGSRPLIPVEVIR